MTKVVVVGKGAREHALAVVLGRTAEVVVTPGSAGIPGSTSTAPEDLDADLFVIGPEAPLIDGLADRLRAQGKTVYGPGSDGAQFEASKIWMKLFFDDAGVPTAPWRWYENPSLAEAYLRQQSPPYVVKTDGNALGKGAFVTDDLGLAIADARSKLSGEAFGEAGLRVVIEEGLIGKEMSYFAVLSAHNWVLLSSAQDYKRLGDGDTGPNTGGMGAYSPVPHELPRAALSAIVGAHVQELRRRGIDYLGTIYGGLMITDDNIFTLEDNIRFGDPEAQVVLPRLTGDLTALLLAAARGEDLRPIEAEGAGVTVVLAAAGYPTEPRTGDVITGIEQAEAIPGVTIFHGGTALDEQGRWVTAGGRVLSVTAQADTVAAARELAYQAVALINFEGRQYRTDIAAGIA